MRFTVAVTVVVVVVLALAHAGCASSRPVIQREPAATPAAAAPTAAAAAAARTTPTPGDLGAAEAAFKRIVALNGEWSAGEEGKAFPARFAVVARGKAVTQDSGFFAVFARDGGTILLTLFPDDGFQQRLRAPAASSAPDTLEFRYVDATNLAPGQGHAASMTMRWAADGSVVETWSWLAAGKRSSFDVHLRRAAPAGPRPVEEPRE